MADKTTKYYSKISKRRKSVVVFKNIQTYHRKGRSVVNFHRVLEFGSRRSLWIHPVQLFLTRKQHQKATAFTTGLLL